MCIHSSAHTKIHTKKWEFALLKCILLESMCWHTHTHTHTWMCVYTYITLWAPKNETVCVCYIVCSFLVFGDRPTAVMPGSTFSFPDRPTRYCCNAELHGKNTLTIWPQAFKGVPRYLSMALSSRSSMGTHMLPLLFLFTCLLSVLYHHDEFSHISSTHNLWYESNTNVFT